MRLTANSSYFQAINGLLISSSGPLISCLSEDTHINIPNSVNHIGDYAFFRRSSLQNIHMPNSVTHIGDCAFWGCSSLQSINIPNSVTHIGISPFIGCPQLRLTSENPHFKVMNGLLVSSDGTLISCLSEDTHINIPNSIIHIGSFEFSLCRSLQNIHISNSVTHIGDGALWRCEALQAIHIPKGSMAKFMPLLPEELHDKLVEIDRVSSSMFPF